MYAGLPERVNPHAFAASFRETLARGEVDVVIVATALGDSVNYPISYFTPALSHPALTALSSRVAGSATRVRLDEYRVNKTSR